MSRLNYKLRDLDQATVGLSRISSKIKKIADISPKLIEFAGQKAALSVTKKARRYLLVNYDKSGIGNTGKLREEIAKSYIVFSYGKKATLKVFLPAKVSPYKKKQGADGFYKASAAQNYGAVITKKNFGEKAKRTIKKQALDLKVSERAGKAVARGRKFKGKIIEGFEFGSAQRTDITKKQRRFIFGDGVVVIAPQKFYQFTATQEGEISQDFQREFFKFLMEF